VPLPKPRVGESDDAFLKRCMEDEAMTHEYRKSGQRYAVCRAQLGSKAARVPMTLFLRSDAGEVEIEAEAEGEKKLRRFSMTAYTGGAMSLGGWPHPVVVDLSGLAIGKKARPILKDHDPGRIVGHTDAMSTDGSRLAVSGVISGVGEAAQEVVGASDNGFPWQASLGAQGKKVVFVPEGKSAAANGREFAGPVYVVRSARLGEVSFVALGADDNTSARVEAAAGNQLMEVLTMDFETWVKAKGIDLAALADEELAKLQAEYEASEGETVVLGKHPPASKGDAAPPAAQVRASAQPPAPVVPAPIAPVAPVAPVAPAAPAAPAVLAAPTAPLTPSVQPSVRPLAAADAMDVKAEASRPEPAPVDVKAEAQKAVKAERERVAAIQEICAGEFQKIEQEAIRAGWTVEETTEKVLRAMRQNRPQADVAIAVRQEKKPMDQTKRLEAALCFRAGIDTKAIVADFGEACANEAYHDRDLSLQQLFVECARAEGITVPRQFCNDTIRAGFSTLSLPGILNSVANKKLLKSFRAQPIIATRLCSEGELTDFKESERYRLTDVGDLEPVAPDGEIKHGGLAEEKATNQLKTYGKMFALTREAVYNDDLALFLRVPEGMGARAARKIDQIFFQRLLANPGSLFSVAHRNYKEGADSALSADSLALAVQMFLDQVDVDGQPINISPRFLLVPTALKMTAKEILNSSILLAVGATNKQRIPTYNPIADEDLEIVSSPYLSNANYPGASSKAWFLFADPAVADTFELGFLRGRREPTIEQGEPDFDRLGLRFRVYFDVACREQDFRGMCKSKGE